MRRSKDTKRTFRFDDLRAGSSKGLKPDDGGPRLQYRADRLTPERLTELADEFEAQLTRETKSPADLVNALNVIALTFQVRGDEIKAEITARS